MGTKKRKRAAITDEQAFLMEYDASRFPHPSVAVDVALISVYNGKLRAVLMQRSSHPDRGKWSLPGTFVRMDESLDEAAGRVLREKVGVAEKRIYLEQLFTFGSIDRDPRTRVISIAYYALVNASVVPTASDLAFVSLDVPWRGEQGGPIHVELDDRRLELAFDHSEILGMVVQRLRGKLRYVPIGFELLPKQFTLRQLQTIHETILDRKQNKDSFRRRMLDGGMLKATGKLEQNVGHRPAELYQFKRKRR